MKIQMDLSTALVLGLFFILIPPDLISRILDCVLAIEHF